MNSPRTFLFSFLVLRDFTNALLISPLVAEESTSKSASCASAVEESPKYAS